ncbi:MAG: class I SAM-dependent methyltransferase [Candidatus Pacearchaeota archaeon]
MEHEEVWNEIAEQWDSYKTKDISPPAKEFLKNKKGKILDLGCGSGRNFIKLTGVKFYGVDFSENMLKLAKKNAKETKIKTKLVKADAWQLPFPNNFFDYAIAVAVLHCINEKSKRVEAIEELNRVLKPGARLFLTVWNKKSKRWRNKPKEIKAGWTIGDKKVYRYYYLYDFEELQEELESAGFKIVKKNFTDKARNLVLIVEK